MRRPLLWALCPVVLWILFFYDPPEDNNIREETATFTAQVAELTGWGEDTSLVVCDVTTDDVNSYCRKLQVYAAADYKTNGKKCSFSHLKIGNIIQIQGKVKPFREPGNPGQFNEITYYHSMGIDARFYADSVAVIRADVDRLADFLHALRGVFRDAFYQALPEREAGILTAMILGEKSGLEDEVKELYRENGIAHILAISGLHISLIGLGLFNLLRRCIMPMQFAAVVTGVVLFLYGELTGFPLATRRAVIMTVLMLIAKVMGERFDRLNALAFSALIELVIHPESLLQSGFLLSYGTVLGITLFVDEFSGLKIASEKSMLQMCYKVISGSVGVFIITLPILIQSYHEVAVFSIPINIIILPCTSVLIGVSIVGGGLGVLSAVVSRAVFGIVYYMLSTIETVCEWVAMIPCHTIIIGQRSIVGIIVYYSIILGVIIYLKNPIDIKKLNSIFHFRKSLFTKDNYGKESDRCVNKRILVLLMINVLIFVVPITTNDSNILPAISNNGLTITNLDIGQGDCTCIRTPGDHVILIDGGSTDVNDVGKYRIVPYLKYMGLSTIDAVILTHSDEDHLSGLTEIIEKDDHFGLNIRQVILPDIIEPDNNYIQFEHITEKAVAAGEDITIRHIVTGDKLIFDDVTMTCLHPSRGFEWEDANDYSTVMELSYGNFRGLFTGDLGIHGEEALSGELAASDMTLDDVDYLKVGHHGSKYSSSDAFLSTIKPEIAVASAGKNNRYHHPSPETVERMKNTGASFYCTIDSGAVTTWTDGDRIKIHEYKRD